MANFNKVMLMGNLTRDPEIKYTPKGTAIMKRFLYDGCALLPDWTPTNVIERSVAAIRAQVGSAQVICGLSGGVDSSVAAALVHWGADVPPAAPPC